MSLGCNSAFQRTPAWGTESLVLVYFFAYTIFVVHNVGVCVCVL